jgi:hypothetical protein
MAAQLRARNEQMQICISSESGTEVAKENPRS